MKKTTPKKNEAPTQEAFNGRVEDRPLYERIAERAYELYQSRGQYHGGDLDDWLEAERIVLSERSSSAAAPSLREKPVSRAKATRKRSDEQKAS